jgi:hypothetical protein
MTPWESVARRAWIVYAWPGEIGHERCVLNGMSIFLVSIYSLCSSEQDAVADES